LNIFIFFEKKKKNIFLRRENLNLRMYFACNQMNRFMSMIINSKTHINFSKKANKFAQTLVKAMVRNVIFYFLVET